MQTSDARRAAEAAPATNTTAEERALIVRYWQRFPRNDVHRLCADIDTLLAEAKRLKADNESLKSHIFAIRQCVKTCALESGTEESFGEKITERLLPLLE